MWSVAGWISAACWGGITTSLLILIVRGNGHLRIQTRLILEVFLVLGTLVFFRSIFAASMEDTFQQALSAIIDGRPMRLNRSDALAFTLWRNFRRAEHGWSVFTFICFIPYCFWHLDEWARERAGK